MSFLVGNSCAREVTPRLQAHLLAPTLAFNKVRRQLSWFAVFFREVTYRKVVDSGTCRTGAEFQSQAAMSNVIVARLMSTITDHNYLFPFLTVNSFPLDFPDGGDSCAVSS
jgi:hypothetical protein